VSLILYLVQLHQRKKKLRKKNQRKRNKRKNPKKTETKKQNIDLFADAGDSIFSTPQKSSTKKEEPKKEETKKEEPKKEEPKKEEPKKEEPKKQEINKDSLFSESDSLFGSIAPTKKEEPKKAIPKIESEGFNPIILPSETKKTETLKVIDKQESSSKEEGVKKVAEEQLFYKRPVADVFGSRDSSLFASDAADSLFSPSKGVKKEEPRKASNIIDIFGDEGKKETPKKEEPKKEQTKKEEPKKESEAKKQDSLFTDSLFDQPKQPVAKKNRKLSAKILK